MVFIDRKSKYPGRWTMKKSDGSSEVVTLIRNDEPIVKGTPLNAETLNELSTVAGAINAKDAAEAAAAAAEAAAKKFSIDDALSESSKNPVENKVVTAAINGLNNRIDNIYLTGGIPEPGTSAWEAFVKAIVDSMGGLTGCLETYERTVSLDSWTEAPSGAFAWVCEVELAAAKASRVPSVVVLPEDFPAAKAAQIVPVCESGDGYIRLWAQEKPEQDLKVQISLYECSETGLGLCVLG